MKRADVSRQKGKFTSGSFLKVLMPRIAKDNKKIRNGKRPDAPNLVGGDRMSAR